MFCFVLSRTNRTAALRFASAARPLAFTRGSRRWIIGPIPAAGDGGGLSAKDDANSIHKRGLPLITQAVALSASEQLHS